MKRFMLESQVSVDADNTQRVGVVIVSHKDLGQGLLGACEF